MIGITGTIRTPHAHAGCVAGALNVDNLRSMTTSAQKGYIVTEIEGTRLRSIIASVDDYLMNLGIAEELCSYGSP
jgi:hypothetical protein